MPGPAPPPVNPEYVFGEVNWDTTRVVSRLYNPVICTTLGFGLGCFMNFMQKRPLFSGIHKHALGAGVGLMIGLSVDTKLAEKAARREAMMRHYITLHPEDFPIPERKQYKDMFFAWTPVR